MFKDITKLILNKLSISFGNNKLSKLYTKYNENGLIYVLDQFAHVLSIFILATIFSEMDNTINALKVLNYSPFGMDEFLKFALAVLIILKAINETFKKTLSYIKPVKDGNERMKMKK